MGMFDYVECEYPLPGVKPKFLKTFQTSDLDCQLGTVTISGEGKLVGYERFTGEVEFYGCNVVAGAPWGRYTRDGEDIEQVTYSAKFVDGELQTVEQTHYSREPALSSREQPPDGFHQMESELNESDSFVGKRLFVLWGGSPIERGYYVDVVNETKDQLCCKSERGMEIIHRFQIGNIILKDREEAAAKLAYREEKIKEAKEDYKRKLAERG